MKSLKEYSLNLPEQEYHDYPAWSYSIIAKYAKNGFSAIPTLFDKVEPTPSMKFGSLFDSIITRGKETLDNYVVSNKSVPDAERKALEYIASRTKEPLDELDRHFITDCCDSCGYQPRWGFDARFKHLIEYNDYYEKLRSGKEVVSEEDWNDAFNMAMVFKNDSYLKSIFGHGNKNGIEYIYQPQFVVDYDIEGEAVKLKCMFDLIVVNHNDKTIQPVDLKTSSIPAYSFAKNFVTLRYDIQAGLYTDVLKTVCNHIAKEYEDYTILPYLFTDISRTDMVPVTYEYDPSNGFSYTKNGKVYEYRGWYELLAEILVYQHNESKVPSYITTSGPNDLISIIESNND